MRKIRAFLAGLIFLTLIISGCGGGGGGGGGGGTTTTSVTVTLTIDGTLTASKTVRLMTYVGGSPVLQYSGMTGPTGSVTITGVIPGNYYASYVDAPLGEFTDPGAGNVKTVTAAGPNTFSIEVTTPPDPPTGS